MPTTAFNGLRQLSAQLTSDATSDRELLARFLAHRDEAAFSALVRRHAAMVFGTCRRILGNGTDADDAFQATFVVLIRKAHALSDRQCVGNYLYGIAYHTALKVKAMAVKRCLKEAQATRPEPAPDQSELLAALDEELARLPEKYRAPVVLCELEGRSRQEAATALVIPEGTISSRLATAHRMLEKRLRARGFTGVCVATVLAALAGYAPAGTAALSDAALKAVLGPTKEVAQLATEVTKMLLLHKIGLGVIALTVLVVGIATAFPANDAPLKMPVAVPVAKVVPAAAPIPADKEPAWKAEFRKVYGLKDGELVRRVAPPYPGCRAEYFKDRIREFYKRNKLNLPAEEELKADNTNYFTKFGWKDGWPVDELTMQNTPVKPDEGVRLVQLIRMTTGFGHTRTEGDAGLLEEKVTGDFVVRAGADPAKVAAELEKILRKECSLNVALAVQEVERDVYILSGKYEAKPLVERKKDRIEIYGFELTDRTTGGGGSGTLQEMADHIEGFIESRVAIGEVQGAPKKVEWHFNYRSPFTAQQRAQDTDAEAVVKNITAQTGLTAKLEKRKIKVLTVKKGE